MIGLDQNSALLQDKLSRMKDVLQDISSEYGHEQRKALDTVTNWLQRLYHSPEHAKGVIDRSRQHRRCLECLFCKPGLGRQIGEWNTNFDQVFRDLQSYFPSLRNAQEIVWSAPLRPEALLENVWWAPLQPEALLQTVPELGFVGLGIKSAQMQLNPWLDAEDHQFRVIGVVGMVGFGKTSLLKTVYNTYKKGNVFEEVICLTVSQINILDLQSIIAKEINLDLGIGSSNAESSSVVLDMPKMKLSDYLKLKKFLLILDDMWNPILLEEERGIPFLNHKSNKVVISTCCRDVIRGIGQVTAPHKYNPYPWKKDSSCFAELRSKQAMLLQKLQRILLDKLKKSVKVCHWR